MIFVKCSRYFLLDTPRQTERQTDRWMDIHAYDAYEPTVIGTGGLKK